MLDFSHSSTIHKTLLAHELDFTLFMKFDSGNAILQPEEDELKQMLLTFP